MSGIAIKLSRFQDHPARRMTLNRHNPLRHNTATLSPISQALPKAKNKDSSTSEIIGTRTFQKLAFTRPKIELPSNSQPESQTPLWGRSLWIAATFSGLLFVFVVTS